MTTTNNSTFTAQAASVPNNQASSFPNAALPALASVTPVSARENTHYTSVESHAMDVEMASPQVSSAINLNEVHRDNKNEGKKRVLETTHFDSVSDGDSVKEEESAAAEQPFRPAKRRGALSSWNASSDAQIQGKKPTEVLADELSDLCKLNK
jgi:hypothetical protein